MGRGQPVWHSTVAFVLTALMAWTTSMSCAWATGPAEQIDRAAALGPATDPRRSGSLDMSPALRAMQADDSQNPALLWVASGRERWRAECQACHGEVDTAMRGVATRYPAHDARSGRVLSLNQRIRACRGRPGGADTAARDGAESEPVLALQALVALQSRGLPLRPPHDATSDALASRGEQVFRRRMGALALSCADCHEARAGLRLGGSLIPQGHPTGYPLYRLEWQGLGSLGRRLRACVVGVRATPFAGDSDDVLALEVYLARRAAGLLMDAPGLRP
ncbi:MAG: sulfur oxidation c-type cytochrome SoxA [Pseudomonadota bacterium]